MDRNAGLVDAMLQLKEKVKEMIREWVALQREQEELQGNNEWLFCKLEWGDAMEAPVAAKRHGLEVWLMTADAGRVVALDALNE